MAGKLALYRARDALCMVQRECIRERCVGVLQTVTNCLSNTGQTIPSKQYAIYVVCAELMKRLMALPAPPALMLMLFSETSYVSPLYLRCSKDALMQRRRHRPFQRHGTTWHCI